MNHAITDVFARICALGAARGVRNIGDLPGCWEVDLADGWWLAVNGQEGPVRCSRGALVAPFHVYLEWQGIPAGIVSPIDGMLAAGAVANESALLAALDAAIAGAATP